MPAMPLIVLLSIGPVPAELDLTGLPIVIAESATDLEITAARELQRYERLLTGVQPHVRAGLPDGGAVILGTPLSMTELGRELPAEVGDEGHVLRVDGDRLLVVGATPVAVQQGVYDLLERLGVGFYLGGDALPPKRDSITVPADLHIVAEPVFRVRGSLPWYNFLNSPTTWNLEDFRFFFDQMAKMRINFVGFHDYDTEPFFALPSPDGWIHGTPAATSENYGWGAVRGLTTEEFGFGTGRLFGQAAFGSRATVDAADSDDAVRRAQCVLAQGLQYAKERGIRTCVGFELVGDPTDPATQALYERKIQYVLAMYPMADAIWLWQSEGLGGGGQGAHGQRMAELARQYGDTFSYLENESRIAEAARVAEFVRFAYRAIRLTNPDIQVVVSGWGGDRWMRFSDFYLGLDSLLPSDIVFSALDNIDPAWEPNVSQVYGQVSPARERWPIPWFESDGGGARRDQWGPQANVAPFTDLCRDALAKGCQGLLSIHWQSRAIEEVAVYAAQFAWDPTLSYEEFYDGYTERCYGAAAAAGMSGIHRDLEALGPRWTGSLGQVECGTFAWFTDARRPAEANLRALARTEARLKLLRETVPERSRERVDYLLATIRFLTDYDKTAVAMDGPGGIVDTVARAEAASAAGDTETAHDLAAEALRRLRASTLDDAMWSYEARLTSQGDYGNLATINVKAYAAWLGLWERANALLPETQRSAPPRAPRPGLHLRAKFMSGVVPEGLPLPVRCAAFSDQPPVRVLLHWRTPAGAWRTTSMVSTGHDGWLGAVPGAAIGADGVEYYLEARDASGRSALWPPAAPETPMTASTQPYRGPVVYDPALVHGISKAPAEAVAVALTGTEYERLRGHIGVAGYGQAPTRTSYHRLTAPLDRWMLEGERLQVYSAAADTQGRMARTAHATLLDRSVRLPEPVTELRTDASKPFAVTVRWIQPGSPQALRHYVIYRGVEGGFDLAGRQPDGMSFAPGWIDVQPPVGERVVYAVAPVDRYGRVGPAAYTDLIRVPEPPLIGPPSDAAAHGAPGRVTVTWTPPQGRVRGFALERRDGEAWTPLQGDGEITGGVYVIAPMEAGERVEVRVATVDTAGRRGPFGEPVSAVAAAPIHEPVFSIDFNGSNAETGQQGTLHEDAKIVDGLLDAGERGWIEFPGSDELQLLGPLSFELWMRPRSLTNMPLILCFGHWGDDGYWLQVLAGTYRFYVPIMEILDAGQPVVGQWRHVAAVYDGSHQILYVNGREIARRVVPSLSLKPFTGPLRIGHYTDLAPDYHFDGQVDDVRVFQRALTPDEVRASFEAGH